MEFTIETIGTSTFLQFAVENDRVDSFALKMLENNRIVGILPFSYMQENQNKKIRYMITSYETLESFIRRPLSLTKILNVWESIAAAALELEDYMLSWNGMLLDQAHMYVEISTGKTHLIYLPIKIGERPDVFTFLREFPAKVQYEEPENAVSILKISNEINGGKITGIGQLLDAIRETKRNLSKPVKKREEPGRKGEEPDGKIVTPLPVPENFLPPEVQKCTEQSESLKVAAPKEEEREKEKKTFGLWGVGRKEKKDNDVEKPVRFGFAVPGAEETSAPELPIPEAAKSEKKSFFGFRKKDKAPQKDTGKVELPLPSNAGVSPEKPVLDKEPMGQLDFGQTVIYQPEDDVTMVESAEEDEKMGISYLTRKSNGQRMYLEKDITKIGRESTYVDFYIGDNPRVGRSHAEIVKENGSFFIRDNFSKNHTYINGKMVDQGKAVQLHTGDQVMFADEEFHFYED